MIKRIILAGLLLAAVAQTATAGPRACLSERDRRAALAAHHFVSLAKAIRMVKARYPGDVVQVRLCQQGQSLVYVLTVLPRNGKVAQASVDAGSGALVGIR